MSQLTSLPDDLPIPEDDGACDHLINMKLPDLSLTTTSNTQINLSQLTEKTVLYFYPMTGRPDVPLPDGWDGIPGARGCTPQSCSFRDHKQELTDLGAQVFGISAQSSDYQCEAKQRLHLPFELLSDESLQLKAELNLPTFKTAGMDLYKRVTLITENAMIKKVFYPVFPPDQNAQDVIDWLKDCE